MVAARPRSRGACAAVGEETAPRSRNQRVDQEHVLVDEVAPHQRLDQLSAAADQEALSSVLLPFTD
jgi:hypothetical protein